MTEQEAWNQCAEWWDAAEDEGDAHRPNWKSARWTTGICGCVGWLESTGKIDEDVAARMLNKIDALPTLTNRQVYPFHDYDLDTDPRQMGDNASDFKFPRTAEGAKQRAAWCRKMAEECGK